MQQAKLGTAADAKREWTEKFERLLLLEVIGRVDFVIEPKVLDEIAQVFGKPHNRRSLA